MQKNYFFKGFLPAIEEERSLRRSLSILQAEAPSDSSIQLSIEKKGDVFSLRARVFSASGNFYFLDQAQHLSCLIEDFQKNLREQFMSWKKGRFLEAIDAR